MTAAYCRRTIRTTPSWLFYACPANSFLVQCNAVIRKGSSKLLLFVSTGWFQCLRQQVSYLLSHWVRQVQQEVEQGPGLKKAICRLGTDQKIGRRIAPL